MAMNAICKKYFSIIAVLLLFAGWGQAFAQDVRVETAVDKQEVFMGEAFNYQIIVHGTNKVEDPKVEEMDGFSVTYYGAQPNSSTSVTIVNGKMSQTVDYSVVFRYKLVPQKTGGLTIPSILVKAEGKSFMTDPVSIRVIAATETPEYKLRIVLSKNSCYAGEKLTLTVTWYFSTKVGNPVFNVPVLDYKSFTIIQPVIKQNANEQYVNVNLGAEQITVKYNQSTGSEFNSVVFQRILVPKVTGNFDIPAASVQFQGVAGYKKAYDFFGREVNQEQYRNFVIPSNALTLNVLPVPSAGKPSNYSGLIGTFTLDAVASPTDVHVGDPITLTLTLRGKGNIEDARLPALDEIPALAKDFKIPKEMAPGEVGDGTKTFTQSLRALRPNVTLIPALEIPYFNSQTGKYEYARSRTIPLTVSPASKDLSVSDMEGNTATEVKREVEVFAEGIAHNYEGPDVLVNQTYGLFTFVTNPLYILLLVLPVGAYVSLLMATRMYRLSRIPQVSKKIAKSIHRLKGLCAETGSKSGNTAGRLDELLDLYKEYIGLKLNLKGASITYNDIEAPLEARGVPEESRNSVKKIFTTCEAASYAGGSYGVDAIGEIAQNILASVSDMERSIR
jgi:hypothetical protein